MLLFAAAYVVLGIPIVHGHYRHGLSWLDIGIFIIFLVLIVWRRQNRRQARE